MKLDYYLRVFLLNIFILFICGFLINKYLVTPLPYSLKIIGSKFNDISVVEVTKHNNSLEFFKNDFFRNYYTYMDKVGNDGYSTELIAGEYSNFVFAFHSVTGSVNIIIKKLLLIDPTGKIIYTFNLEDLKKASFFTQSKITNDGLNLLSSINEPSYININLDKKLSLDNYIYNPSQLHQFCSYFLLLFIILLVLNIFYFKLIKQPIYIVIFFLMFINFQFGLIFRLMPGQELINFFNFYQVADSAALVKHNILANLEHFNLLYPLGGSYYQQIGLQGKIFSLIAKLYLFKTSQIINLVFIFEIINSLLMAGVFLLIILYVKRNFGTASASLVFLILNLSLWLVAISRNIYWCYWSMYLPFVYSLLYLEKYSGKYKTKYWISIFFLFILKFSMGFEFASTFVIMSTLPSIYYFMLDNNRCSTRSLYNLCLLLCEYIIITFCAFFTVLFFTIFIIKVGKLLSWTEAYNFMLKIISYRTGVGKLTVTNPILVDSIHASYLSVLNIYFNMRPIFVFPGVFPTQLQTKSMVNFTNIVIFTGFILLLRYKYINLLKIRILIYTLFLSLLAPLSWYILAKPHSFVHWHIDAVLWSSPSLIYFAILLGCLISINKDK